LLDAAQIAAPHATTIIPNKIANIESDMAASLSGCDHAYILGDDQSTI
jgi:hypothetical protein